MITVYFVQHGIALAKDVDETRSLSDAGADEVRKVANTLKNQDVSISKIVHSGKLRALQTASIFSQILDIKIVSELKGMAPNDIPEKLIEQITEDAVMYIGHLPNIQNVVSNLVTGNNNNSIIKFQNAAVACVEINEDKNHIKWFITPELCQ
ncbi:MAG: phosphohistidine phosphatase SixA [gamma proteobacterium symbiont of Taylorina sp.]|nr:phosphohistidine phosphatase SixA [gamma proteobacterium symbiont of Taylorina sp.]